MRSWPLEGPEGPDQPPKRPWGLGRLKDPLCLCVCLCAGGNRENEDLGPAMGWSVSKPSYRKDPHCVCVCVCM